MQFAVDPWDPEYGSATEGSVLAPSEVPTELDVETPVGDWRPQRPDPNAVATTLYVVDGVRRIDARVWITAGDGQVRPGVCASYAAGVVCCNHRAKVVAAKVERAVFSPAALDPIETPKAVWRARATSGDDIALAAQAVLAAMGRLEVEVASEATAGSTERDLVIVDGPLSQHRYLAGAVGSIKSQHTSYGPPIVGATVAALTAGERTPVFVVGDKWQRYSWYLRLPGPVTHPWAAVVRCEATTELGAAAVVALADRTAATLPRFASAPHKDSRAPQNLYPIAGLERELRRRLGDPALLYRCLRAAAAAA